MKKKKHQIWVALIAIWFAGTLFLNGTSLSQSNESESNQVEKIQREIDKIDKMIERLQKLHEEAQKSIKHDKHENITFTEKVLSFELLDQAEKYEDLPKYGLLAPWQYNHKSGKNLVLLALQATSWFNGDWVLAHGLLGVNMLDINVYERIAYKSLFLSLTQRVKMHASHLTKGIGLLTTRSGIIQTQSIIVKREAAINNISFLLNARYNYDDAGNFARNYFPEQNRKSNKMLRQSLSEGLKIYDELKAMGYDDRTLKDTLGMACASLNYDTEDFTGLDAYKLTPLQVYRDALEATLKKLSKIKNHNLEFLEILGLEMELRGLAAKDEILLPEIPENYRNFQTILKIIKDDLDRIKKSPQ
jgi:hypothetical protein